MPRDNETDTPRQSESPLAGLVADASAERLASDLLAELRSEDDGMPEHADKAADPVRWAARRGEPVGMQ